jgi:glycosyltransferase involved in cell wall biosynthesis
LRSVQQQTYRELEIILIDDGSTDDSGQICDEFSSLDRRFRVIHKENGGVSLARNAGIDLASGRYIAFVDPDDYLSHDFYEKLYNALVENDTDIAVSGVTLVNESGAPRFNETVQNVFLGKSILYDNNNAVLEGIFSNRIACESKKYGKRRLYPTSYTAHVDFLNSGERVRPRKIVMFCNFQDPHVTEISLKKAFFDRKG